MTTDPHSASEGLTEAPDDAQGHDKLLYANQIALHKGMLAGADIDIDEDYLPHSVIVRVQAVGKENLRQALTVLEYAFGKMLRDLDKPGV
jgi:hypothetical protein